MTRELLSQLSDWQLVHDSQDIRGQTLYDADGRPLGKIDNLIVNTDTEYVDAIVVDGREIPANALEIGDNTVYLRDERTRRGDGRELAEGTGGADGTRRDDAGEMRLPVVEEELDIRKRQVPMGGIRVTTRIKEQPVEEQVTLRDERLDIHREPADRQATEEDLARVQEGSFEVHETDEKAIVDKQARVVEEVHIDKEVSEQDQTIRDTVRRSDVDVERLREREANQ